jgi:hypothetical protein
MKKVSKEKIYSLNKQNTEEEIENFEFLRILGC